MTSNISFKSTFKPVTKSEFSKIALRIPKQFSVDYPWTIKKSVTAVEAMKSAGPTAGSDKLAAAVKQAISDIEEGSPISNALEKSGLFPPMVTGMVAIGEESGALPELLDKVAEFFEEDVENTSRNLRAMIEPLALVFVGVVVGGMLIALYVPMLTASTSIGA